MERYLTLISDKEFLERLGRSHEPPSGIARFETIEEHSHADGLGLDTATLHQTTIWLQENANWLAVAAQLLIAAIPIISTKKPSVVIVVRSPTGEDKEVKIDSDTTLNETRKQLEAVSGK